MGWIKYRKQAKKWTTIAVYFWKNDSFTKGAIEELTNN